MATLNTIQELTQKIHKHCPELLELSFGCVLRLPDTEFYKDVPSKDKCEAIVLHCNGGGFNGEDYDGDFMRVYSPAWDKETSFEGTDELDMEILGHPITLEHILKVINESDDNDAHNIPDETYEEVVWQWDWCKPLSEQSQETIEWLNKIIV